MNRLARTTLLAVSALAPMSAPAVARAKADYATRCMFEMSPKGYYTYEAAKVPVVVPAEGGTAAEAAALNACIQAKAAADGKVVATKPAKNRGTYTSSGGAGGTVVRNYTYGTPPASTPVQEYGARAPAYTKRQRGASALSGGAGYHGSYLEGGTGQRASLTAPEGTRKTWWQRVFGGVGGKGVSLPAGYPLMPGDEALWNSLTVAQQERARRFLEDGSTIRSSLKPDY